VFTERDRRKVLCFNVFFILTFRLAQRTLRGHDHASVVIRPDDAWSQSRAEQGRPAIVGDKGNVKTSVRRTPMATEQQAGGAAARPKTTGTLGLTGLTSNAMALIAPGAFLWLTYQMQSLYGAPMAGCAMWFGILAALLLCFATAISYAELSKLYPGAGSSYLYAEQAFLGKTHAYKYDDPAPG
jgi:hypothetical protein